MDHHGAEGTLQLNKVDKQNCLVQNKLQCPATWLYSRFGFLGEMIFIMDGLKVLKNRDFKTIDDFRISQKYNLKLPKNNSVSFLGSGFRKSSRIFLTQEGCKDEEEKFQRTVREEDNWQVY